jgi:hypothetical protein
VINWKSYDGAALPPHHTTSTFSAVGVALTAPCATSFAY